MGRIKEVVICILFGLGTIGTAQQAHAEIVTVSGYEDVIPDAGANGGRSVEYQTFDLRYDGAIPTNKVILLAAYWNGKKYAYAGGVNGNYPENPGQAIGHFNQEDATYTGLAGGESPDTWYGGIDLNGDGDIGRYDNQAKRWYMDPGESLSWHQVLGIGFTPFPSSGGGVESIGTIKIRSRAGTVLSGSGWSNGMPTAENNAYFVGVNVTGTDDFTAAALIMGIGSSATLTQSDGTVTVEDLILGSERDGGRGTYEMDGGTLNVADSVYVGKNGNGIFRQNEIGTNVTIGKNLYIGGYSGSTGTYTISGGNYNKYLDVRNGNIFIGPAGTGTLDASGGTVWADEVVLGNNGTFITGSYTRLRVNQLTGFFEKGISTFGHLQIGHSGGRGEADFVMPEGLDLTMRYLTVGYDSNGTFIQDHGTLALSDSLYIGQEAGSNGTYELSGTGLLDVTNGMCVGYRTGGVGTFKQDGGIMHASHLLQVYPGSRYELNAGQCLAGGHFIIQGAFQQTGGDIQVGGGWFFEIINIEAGGIYDISGGSLATPNLFVGNATSGTMNVADAAATIKVSEKLFWGPNSVFTAVAGTTIYMEGSVFENQSSSPEDLAGLTNLTLIFEGDSEDIALFEVAGENMGTVLAGFDGNFALGTLQVGGEDSTGNLQLVDMFDNQPGWVGDEALYVENLIIGAGSSLDLNGLNLYYKTLADFGGIINLNGGSLTQIPEPATLWVISWSGLIFLRRKYRKVIK